MKVTATGAKPPIIMDTMNSQAQSDAKARAIAKLTGQVQTTPVQNPSQVQVEELPAIQTAQKPINEATQAEDTSQTPEKTDTPPDAHLQALIRREKSLRQAAHKQEQAFKTREEALAKREAELNAKAKEYETGYIPKERLKQNASVVLAEELGNDYYQRLTEEQLNQQNVNPQVQALINKLQQKVTDQDKALEEIRKGQETQNQESYDAAIRVIRNDINKLVKSDTTGDYEFVRANGKSGINEAVKLIELHFKDTGETMAVDDALAEVEQEYLERFERYNKLPKAQKRLQGQTTQPTVNEQTPAPTKQPQPMKTLTNANTTQRQLSAKERAILAFEGKLKG